MPTLRKTHFYDLLTNSVPIHPLQASKWKRESPLPFTLKNVIITRYDVTNRQTKRIFGM